MMIACAILAAQLFPNLRTLRGMPSVNLLLSSRKKVSNIPCTVA